MREGHHLLKLVVVESPAKAKTIEKYLGPGYRVLASYGHVRDLPPKDGSVDPDDGFAMDWESLSRQGEAAQGDHRRGQEGRPLILATDPDREGEAISWHVQEVLRQRRRCPRNVERVTFNAITKAAVTEAMKHPRELDEDLIDAYRARRALDYLVGFTLSPVLWRKLPGAKSAGRVQSVALRLIVDREREIEAVPRAGILVRSARRFEARRHARSPRGWSSWNGKKIDRLTIGDEGRRRRRRRRPSRRGASPSSRSRPSPPRATRRRPSPPRRCSRRRRASSASRRATRCASRRRSTRTALITYMRTDGVQMAPRGDLAPRARAIANRYDAGYVPDKPRHYQTKAKNAQEAHEAIRPTDFGRTRAGSGDHARLYELIWKRALASQMASARLERTTVELADGTGRSGASRDRPGRPLPRLSRAVRGRPRRQGDDEDGAALPRLREGDAPAEEAASTPSSISPSRRRAFPKRAWSSGWRNSASAAPRPMRRRSRR